MEIRENFDLSSFNTFGVQTRAKYFVVLKKKDDLTELFRSKELKKIPKMFLGGGSNVLFTKDYEGLVVLNKLEGINCREDGDSVFVHALGGENWHNLVLYTASQNWWGIENLAYIPGSVGASPVQNIGAYGAELKDSLVSVEAVEIETGEEKIFSNTECEFGYRESVFKKKHKDKYFIYAINLKLNKKGKPNVAYKALAEYAEKEKINFENPMDVVNAVVAVRKSKLPDPKVCGNAGSFFKNIYISPEQKELLLKEYPDIPIYIEDENIKVPTGWLIEKCDWRGRRIGNAGVHDKQALVLVNHGGATGAEILSLAKKIQDDVFAKFGITILPEVNIV